jgi:HEAT repeat protein
MNLLQNPGLRSVLVLCSLLVAGCGGEERAPFQAGGRQVKDWVADLNSPKAAVRRQAVHKLGNVGDTDPTAAEALTVALGDKDPLVRHDAVLGVLKLGKPTDTITNLLESMAKNDKDAGVRDIAQKALTKLGRGS